MSILKLFGFTADEQAKLSRHVYPARCEAAGLDALAAGPRLDEVWVVSVTAAEAARQVRRASPLAEPEGKPDAAPQIVLWVPQGQAPLPFAQWGDAFAFQLWEEREEDRAVLQRSSRCPRALEWNSRVADLPAAWFATLNRSPYRIPVDELPLQVEEKDHLHGCAACREEVYMRLHQQAALRWVLWCPSAEEVTAWLEAEAADPDMEAHVAQCGLCQELVQWHAQLWEGAGLLTATQVRTKLVAVGLGEPGALVWLAASIDAWEQARTYAASVAYGVLVTAWLMRQLQPTRLARTAEGPAEDPAGALAALAARLQQGGPVTLLGETQSVQVRIEDETVLVQADSPTADPLGPFRVEFRRGTDVLVAVDAEDGMVRLQPDHFQAAEQGHADRFLIVRLDALRQAQEETIRGQQASPVAHESAPRFPHVTAPRQEEEESEELTVLLAASEGHGIAAGEHPPEQLTLDPIGTFAVEGIRYEALADAEGNVFLQPAPAPGKTHLVLDDVPYVLRRAEGDEGLCQAIGLGRGQLELFFALRSIEEDQHRIGFKE